MSNLQNQCDDKMIGDEFKCKNCKEKIVEHTESQS